MIKNERLILRLRAHFDKLHLVTKYLRIIFCVSDTVLGVPLKNLIVKPVSPFKFQTANSSRSFLMKSV